MTGPATAFLSSRHWGLNRLVVWLIGMFAGALQSCCAFGAARGAPPEDAFPLVEQALRAKQTLCYIARQDIVMAPPAGSDTKIEIVTDIVRKGRQFRLTYLMPPEVAHRVILDDGVRSRQYEPSRHALIIGNSRMANASGEPSRQMLTLLRSNYQCVFLRREVVNGYLCSVVSLRPHCADDPWQVCWIAVANHALLRTEEYNASGWRLYVCSYETIRFLRHLPADALSLPNEAQRAKRQSAAPSLKDLTDFHAAFTQAGVPGWIPAWLPAGYALIGCGTLNKKSGGGAAVLRYTDGLKMLSLFEEAATGGIDDAHKQSTLNRMLARYGQQAWVRTTNGIRMTLLGDMTLPDRLGVEMMTALAPQTSERLQQAVTHDFGKTAAQRAEALQRNGWGYDQIVSLYLLNTRRRWSSTQERTLRAANLPWPEMASRLHADVAGLQAKARAWIAAALANPHQRN